MPMDGFTLSFMQRELSQALAGARVDKVNQPERDALVLTLRTRAATHKLLLSANANQARVQLTAQTYENPAEPPMFCMLMRKHLSGARLLDVRQVGGDRILKLTFEGLGELGDPARKHLYLEMMGRYSDLTLTDDAGVIIDCIRHVNSEMSRVRTLLPGGTYVLPPAQEKLDPFEMTVEALADKLAPLTCTLEKALMESVRGMASVCAKEACEQMGFASGTRMDELDARGAAERIAAYYESLPDRFQPVALTDEAGLVTDFFAFPYLTRDAALQKPYATLSEAMDAFYLGRDLRLRMQQRSAGLQRHIKSNVERLEKKKAIMLETISQAEQAEQNRVFGELLTANMHLMQKSAASVTVTNYYDGSEVSIPLSPQLTPSKNAQAYFKKYRKAKAAEQYAQEHLEEIDGQLELLDQSQNDLENCVTAADLAEVRQLLTEAGFVRPDPAQRKRKKPVVGQPYRFSAPDGTEIAVGKNALQNDRLTLHARPEETWLHAQGIPGSHVLIRTESEPSDEALLYAAKLAVYFSKGRNHPSLPIDYARRRYIKKSANSPAGLVTYTHFKTLLVGLTQEEMNEISRLAAR